MEARAYREQNVPACSYSFSALIKARFSDQLYAELYKHAEWQKIQIVYASIRDIFVTGTERDLLYADVLYDCKVKDREGKIVDQTFVSDFCCNVCDEFQTILVRSVCATWPSFKIRKVLDDSLVPYLQKEDMDAKAEQIIKELYPVASKHAKCVSPCTIAHRLGLSIEYACIDPAGDIMGKVFFEDGSAVVYDLPTNVCRIIQVKSGTILVNQGMNGEAGRYSSNNTVMHECVHWLLHRFAFQLMKAYEPDAASYACRRTSGRRAPAQWTVQDRMEWQANALSPRILLPKWSTSFFASILAQRMAKNADWLRTERIVETLSSHFCVSKSLAWIRLVELGYAAPDPHIGSTVQYEVDPSEAAQEYQRNEAFQSVLREGNYAFVDNRFCVRSKRYIERDETGGLHLTAYAKSHAYECCLPFRTQYRYLRAFDGMCRGKNRETVLAYPETDRLTRDDPASTKTQIARIAAIQRQLPATFDDTLVAHMKRLGLSEERLAERSGLSSKTVQRCRNTQGRMLPTRTVVAICVGLQLPPVLCRDLVLKSGVHFRPGIDEDIAYQMIIDSMTASSIYECNEFLDTIGIRPLGA